jgi:hypothetical protein
MIGRRPRWRCIAVAVATGYRCEQHTGKTPAKQPVTLKAKVFADGQQPAAWHAAMDERITGEPLARFRILSGW